MQLREFTYANVIERNARRLPNRTAFTCGGERITHGDFAIRVASVAKVLQDAGVGVGVRVAILARNKLAYLEVVGAAAWLGAILVPINWRLSPEEIAFIISDAAPRVVIADDSYSAIGRDGVVEFASVHRWFGIGACADPFVWLESAAKDAAATSRAVIPASSAFLMFYTAAINGKPRGALVSHAGVIAGSAQLLSHWSLTAEDVNLGLLPLFHLAGMTILFATQHAGGRTVLTENFEPIEAAQLIRREGVTLFGEFAPMLGRLLDAASPTQDFGSLRIVAGLDAPETIEHLQRMCASARFWSVYGQSETSGLVSTAPFDERPGSVGRPMMLSTVAIVDAFDREQPVGAVGEIAVRGPVVFSGYWQRENETEATFQNGWHHTGDIGMLDTDGYLWYKGRTPAKELIKSGGENVYPTEIEEAIKAHPAILEAVVFGVPDPEWGEAIKAVCVCRPGMSTSTGELAAFLSARVARYKRPRKVTFVDSLPKTSQGTIDRLRVRHTWPEG